MSDTNIKQVTVMMTAADEKALTRTTRRRKRSTLKGGEESDDSSNIPAINKISNLSDTNLSFSNNASSSNGSSNNASSSNGSSNNASSNNVSSNSNSPNIPITNNSTNNASSNNVSSSNASSNSNSPNIPITNNSTNNASIGGAVKIQTRKRHSKSDVQQPIIAKPKIVLTKRHATLSKKPKLVIPMKDTQSKTTVQPITSMTRKRKFTERKVSISMKNASSTRKYRKIIKSKIEDMTDEQVQKTLLAKGLIRSGKKIPATTLRSLLKEYMLLHNSE